MRFVNVLRRFLSIFNTRFLPTDAAAGAAASGLDIGAIIQDVAGGGIGGAVLTIVVALIKGAMNKG